MEESAAPFFVCAHNCSCYMVKKAFLLHVGYERNPAWSIHNQDVPRRIIHLVAKDVDGKVVVVQVPEWLPWAYVRRAPSEGERFFSWLKEGNSEGVVGCVESTLVQRQLFVGFGDGARHDFAKLRFKDWPPSAPSSRNQQRLLEADVHPASKFMHETDLRCGAWFEWCGGQQTRLAHLHALPDDCTPPRLLVCAWDLETTSLLPSKGAIHQVCLIFHDTSKQLDASTRDPRSIVICTQPTASIDGTPVVVVENEKQLLLKMRAIIVNHNPDVLMGFNTGAFDIAFLRHRLGVHEGVASFFDISRIPNTKAYFREKTLQNSAMGTNQRVIWTVHGRLNIDLWLWAKGVSAMRATSVCRACATSVCRACATCSATVLTACMRYGILHVCTHSTDIPHRAQLQVGRAGAEVRRRWQR